MAKKFKKTAIKTEKNEKKFKKSDFSVIARREATKQSREGTWVQWIATSPVGAFRNDDG